MWQPPLPLFSPHPLLQLTTKNSCVHTTTTTSVCARSTTTSPYSILTTVLPVLHIFCTAIWLCFCVIVFSFGNGRSSECPWLHYFVFEQLSGGWGAPPGSPGEGFKSVIIEPRTGIWQPEGSSGGILFFTLFFFRLLSKKRGRASRLALRWFQQWK